MFGFSVSHTTRARRDHEADGVDYHYVDREEFERLREDGAFLETFEYKYVAPLESLSVTVTVLGEQK